MKRNKCGPSFDDALLIPESLTLIQRCINCNRRFQELSNVGLLRCRIHPGMPVRDNAGRFYHSCCNTPLDASFSREPSDDVWIVDGCLAVDHMSLELDKYDIEKRLQQLDTFATIVIPSLFYSFDLTPPLSKLLLYKFKEAGDARNDILRFPLVALEMTEWRNSGALATKYLPSHPSEQKGLRVGQLTCVQKVHNSGQNSMTKRYTEKEHSVSEILNTLYEEYKGSPIFFKMTSSAERRSLSMEELCDTIWTDRYALERRERALFNVKQTSRVEIPPKIIPFSIVQRVDIALDAPYVAPPQEQNTTEEEEEEEYEEDTREEEREYEKPQPRDAVSLIKKRKILDETIEERKREFKKVPNC